MDFVEGGWSQVQSKKLGVGRCTPQGYKSKDY